MALQDLNSQAEDETFSRMGISNPAKRPRKPSRFLNNGDTSRSSMSRFDQQDDFDPRDGYSGYSASSRRTPDRYHPMPYDDRGRRTPDRFGSRGGISTSFQSLHALFELLIS